MMKHGFLTIVAALAASSFAGGQEAKLVDDKVLSLGGEDGAASPVNAARLSPDGNLLLYAKSEPAPVRPEGYSGPWSGHLYRPTLLDLASGKEKALPGPAWTWTDPLQFMLAMNAFAADGKRVVLGVGVTATAGDIFRDREGTMKPGVYDIAADQMELLPIEGKIVLASFDRTGKNLIIVALAKNDPPKELIVTPAEKFEPRKVNVSGITFTMCPTADLLPILTLPERDQSTMVQSSKFSLYDLKAEKAVAELPFGKGNTKLDDYPPRWTADGRYLCYFDISATTTAPAGARQSCMRIWDRTANKEAGTVEGAIPVGPGPGATTMVLAVDNGKSLALYDVATSKQYSLVLAGNAGRIHVLCAGSGKILYATQVAPGKTEYHLAKIQMPVADK